ncbi:MAG TPA: hypothetical protein VHT91_40735 [Kofleriaceae bacterium]|jgi:hypothetical protein|nr:hypothetical protein [Kofleriaceae bacterium]
MLNDILLGRATLEGEKREADPFRAPGAVQSVACATCGAVVSASEASGTRCRRCVRPARPAALTVAAPPYDPALEIALARDAERAKGRTDIGYGLVLLVIGIVLTAVTYGSASETGGTYIIAYGPIIVGLIRIFRGLARLGG